MKKRFLTQTFMTNEFVTLVDENKNREKVEGRRQKLKRGRR
ncbi:hypothetical protein DBT_0383 [Dissulfuribacter thermophilus]|uniref:Uncharacterized protein n=1 Tax=Dissulfuribacter thermophilus TaxID=1156395 RepID=A0A1B9F9N0_9BACT|nr:hypothetical protein DBT_0383 [Dissulfuribacter thermophilus]